MNNPTNNANITVSKELHERLTAVKTFKGWTYNKLINELCELEFKNNYIERTIEYELFVADEIFRFKINFKKDNMEILYYNGIEYVDKISQWGVPKSVQNALFEFINEDCARCILLNIPVGLVFEEFDIYKVG